MDTNLPPPSPQEIAILSIRQSVNKIEREIISLREAVATYAVNVIETRDAITREISDLRTDLAKTRDYRFQKEEQQINAQLERVEHDANELRKQLEEVQKAKSTGGTSEKIEAVATRVFTRQAEEAQKTQQLKTKTVWEKRKDAAATAIIVTFAVGAAVALFVLLLPPFIKFLQALAQGLQ